ncbi:phage holin family protein [Gloeobacter morelensis]|uniref:Phage holin family protein n=1 Tax=Gloeobacter morelensis MG652769 TaxID=2781736 RepID=A0ABY3PKU5_9CYAN|nr:phage holin family protein [Gloeobacter morelensis]UFP94234.1 phage holin family protein [Gloeobacter morelensis MG652769]
MQRQSEANLGLLMGQLVSQVEQLLSAHLRLARQELAADGKQFATQSGGIVIGGILAVLGVAFVGLALIRGLEIWLAPWLAALIVAALFLGGGGLIALSSVQRLGKIDQLGRTREETQETIAWLTRKQ